MTLSNNPEAVRVAVTAHCAANMKGPVPCVYPDCRCASKHEKTLLPILSALDPIIAEAVARERERCAKACDGYFPSDFMPNDVARAIKHRIKETDT